MLEVSTRDGECEGQFEFTAQVTVEKAAEDVYPLIDLADERNARRQYGDEVRALDDTGQRFRLVIRFMPDLQFDYQLLEAVKPRAYAYDCVINPRVGHLVTSRESYLIEPAGEQQCVVTFSITAQFETGLSQGQTEEVLRNMRSACHNNLAKLKANAEHGVGTIEAFENTKLR